MLLPRVFWSSEPFFVFCFFFPLQFSGLLWYQGGEISLQNLSYFLDFVSQPIFLLLWQVPSTALTQFSINVADHIAFVGHRINNSLLLNKIMVVVVRPKRSSPETSWERKESRIFLLFLCFLAHFWIPGVGADASPSRAGLAWSLRRSFWM